MFPYRETIISGCFVLVETVCLISCFNDWVINDSPFGSVALSPNGSLSPLASRVSFGTPTLLLLSIYYLFIS